MEFICSASGNLHKNIYITSNFEEYVCWYDLTTKDQNWHRSLQRELESRKDKERKSQHEPKDLVFPGLIHTPDETE